MQGEFLLETRNLTKDFAGFVAVNDVNFGVTAGGLHAMIGPNGAGKTTFFNLLTKFLLPSNGQIFFKGQDITYFTPEEVAGLGIVRSFQISAIFPRLTVLENVRVALQRKLRTHYFFWRTDRSLSVLNGKAEELLALVGLQDFLHSTANSLPYGHKRALEIAMSLALEPELMLLDEPTAGMGQEGVAAITQLIRRISSSITIVMVEHNLGVVADLSDRITVLQHGGIIFEGSYIDAAKDSKVIEAYFGTGNEYH